MRLIAKAAAVLALITISLAAAGCSECPGPYFDCETPPEEPTITPAPTLKPVSVANCPLDQREYSAYWYWGTVKGWTTPTTALVTNVNHSGRDNPDIDLDNMTDYELVLADVQPIPDKAQLALEMLADTNPAGSWIRFTMDDEIRPGRFNRVGTSNHHGWSNELILAEAGAAWPTGDADQCIRDAFFASNPLPPVNMNTLPVNNRSRDPHGADLFGDLTGNDRFRKQSAPDQPGVSITIDQTTDDPETITVTVTSADGSELASETIRTAMANPDPPTDDTPTEQQPTPAPTTTPTPTPTATPVPAPLSAYGVNPSQAGGYGLERGETIALAGCHPETTEPRERKWTILTEDDTTATFGNSITVYAPDRLTLEPGYCYVLAGEWIGRDDWRLCDADPYGQLCSAETDEEASSGTLPAYRFMPGTLRPIPSR